MTPLKEYISQLWPTKNILYYYIYAFNNTCIDSTYSYYMWVYVLKYS